MQLRWCLAAVALFSGAVPAVACELALGLGGTLALSADATRFGSDEAGGAAKLLTITNLSLQSATITVGAPTLYEYPSGFDASGALVSVAYSSLLDGAQQAHTTQASSFPVAALQVATVLTVHNRIFSTRGFATGTYRTRTVVTCS